MFGVFFVFVGCVWLLFEVLIVLWIVVVSLFVVYCYCVDVLFVVIVVVKVVFELLVCIVVVEFVVCGIIVNVVVLGFMCKDYGLSVGNVVVWVQVEQVMLFGWIVEFDEVVVLIVFLLLDVV